MESDLFYTARPQDPRLIPLIDYYYFHRSQQDEGSHDFIFYPNTYNGLTIYQNSIVRVLGDRSETIPSTEEFCLSYITVQTKAFQVVMHRPFNKLGVVFKPLGFNHFIEEKLTDFLRESDYLTTTEDWGVGMREQIRQVFATEDPEIKARLLDDFFSSRLIPFRESRLQQVVDLIHTAEESLHVGELADRIGVSRRTLGRLFEDHLRCNPKAYLKVVQFRKALNTYMNTTPKPKLIELAMNSDFYDQSEFIHTFKKITGYNPKYELSQILPYSQHGTYWKSK